MKEQGLLKEISIDELNPSSLNSYEVESEGITQMKTSLLSVGLLTPLTVVKKADGYCIVSGERRYTALKELIEDGKGDEINIKEKMIPCYVYTEDEISDENEELIIELSNLETRDFMREQHRHKVIQILFKMQEQGKIEERELASTIAERLGTSNRYARHYKQIFKKGIDEVQKLMSDSKLLVADASHIAGFPEEEQEEIVEMIIEGVNPKEAINNARKEVAEHGTKKIQALTKDGSISSAEAKKIGSLPMTKQREITNIIDNGGDINAVLNEIKDNTSSKKVRDILNASDDELCEMFSDSLEIDSSGMLKEMKSKSDAESKARYEEKLEGIIQWCERICTKTKLTSLELDAIDACKMVASTYM